MEVGEIKNKEFKGTKRTSKRQGQAKERGIVRKTEIRQWIPRKLRRVSKEKRGSAVTNVKAELEEKLTAREYSHHSGAIDEINSGA